MICIRHLNHHKKSTDLNHFENGQFENQNFGVLVTSEYARYASHGEKKITYAHMNQNFTCFSLRFQFLVCFFRDVRCITHCVQTTKSVYKRIQDEVTSKTFRIVMCFAYVYRKCIAFLKKKMPWPFHYSRVHSQFVI